MNLLNELENYYKYQITWLYKKFITCQSRFIAIITGNQFGKTAMVARSYVQRILRNHPVKEKNISDNDISRTFRFCSENLPVSVDSGEIRNTQYIEFKKWLPQNLIKKDVSQRNQVMIIADPYGGEDIKVEFISYNQSVQSTAGFQRKSIWFDEHAPKYFYEEQLPRILASNGDMIFTLTPVQDQMNWEYDEIFSRAKYIYRTKAVRDRIKKRFNKIVQPVEELDSRSDISIFMAATDDNPTLDPNVIDDIFLEYSDDEIVDIRRYGIFRQISGLIFKEFDSEVHIIEPFEIPHDWIHARAIDFHQYNDWAVVWLAISPEDEAFVYDELSISPIKYNVLEICNIIASKSKDYKYMINLIDPLSASNQPSLSISVLDDINRIFYELKKQNLCEGGYWQTWDTKSTRGRDVIKRRLSNAKLVGRPKNNKIVSSGTVKRLSTLWIFRNCKNTIESIKNWKREEYTTQSVLVYKDQKDKPQQKYSHFPMCLEAIFKNPYFEVDRYKGSVLKRRDNATLYV